jgi:hypothetical protein
MALLLGESYCDDCAITTTARTSNTASRKLIIPASFNGFSIKDLLMLWVRGLKSFF